jgi:adenine-specific DNA-methyltransferase
MIKNKVSDEEIVKRRGVVYTPQFMVNIILENIQYNSSAILCKHVIDNSCGNGAFLIEIVKRYISYAKKVKSSIIEITKQLETYIHGIEIDYLAYKECIANLNAILKEFNINISVNWDIKNADSLKVAEYNHKMDFVIGNPPYVNIHNLKGTNYKDFEFTKKGSIDLYLIFFEIGIKMLNQSGKLAYITPNSFLTSKAGTEFRKYIIENKMLKMYIDNNHEMIFDTVQTYTGVTFLDMSWNSEECLYKSLKSKTHQVKSIADFYINNKFYFKTTSNAELRTILNYHLTDDVVVRNGIATNANSVFLNYNGSSKISKKVIKIKHLRADFDESKTIIFPYDAENNLISLSDIKKRDLTLYNYLQENKIKLSSRKSLEKDYWWSYARTQGFSAITHKKLIISNIMRTPEQVILKEVNKDILIYGSGYFIISNSKKYNLKWIKNMMQENAQQFIEYITLIGKNKGSSYYFFNSEDLNRFISYFIDLDKQNKVKFINSKLEVKNIPSF